MKANRIQKPMPKAARSAGLRQCATVAANGDCDVGIECIGRTRRMVKYSSRIASHIARQQQAHRLRHVISQLAARLPESERNSDAVKELAGCGCPTRMHVVRLLPQLDRENHTKDIDFSRSGIRQRWDAG